MRGSQAARIGAATLGTLGLLLAPAFLGEVLTGDADPALEARPASDGPTSSPVRAPVDGAPAPADPTGLPAVPAAPRPAPVGVTGPPASPSPPVHVAIPTLGVSSDLEALGVRPDGSLAPPQDYDRAGWFAAGVEPGQPGPAVIAGHVDSRAGPAVFDRLAELAPGDEIIVQREDGSALTFRVTGTSEHPKSDFPTEAVYGPVPNPELRLVTCAGAFDDGPRALPGQPRGVRGPDLTARGPEAGPRRRENGTSLWRI